VNIHEAVVVNVASIFFEFRPWFSRQSGLGQHGHATSMWRPMANTFENYSQITIMLNFVRD